MGDADAESAPFAWKAYLDGLSDRIAVSSVTGRCAALETELLPLIAERPLEDKELVALLATLKRTIGIYVDRASRAAVLAVLRKLAAAKPQVFVKAVAAVLDPVVESLQPKKTAHPDAIPTPLATRFVLLPWITTALPVPVSLAGAKPEDLPNDAAWRRLVTLAARLLWGIAPAHPGAGDTKASSMSRSAHCEVWRMLRGAPVLIAPMLAVLTAETGEAAAVLLGNVVSTASRIASDDARQAVAAAKDSVVGFIERELVCAKMPVSYSSVADMRDFLRCHVGNDFDALFRPSISKMLVRAPECVLPTCLWLLQALGPDGADLTALYLEVLADPLASNMLRSTNDSVRSAAVELLAYLSGVPATEEAAVAAASILIKPMELGRYTQPEQRVAAYKLLGGVRAGPESGWASSVAILPALVRMAARETQEEPVRALFAAIGAHLRVIVDHLDAAVDPASSAYTQCEAAVRAFAQAAAAGLALPDRSAVVRQAWAAGALGEPLWSRAAEGCKTGPWMSTHILPLLRRLVAAAEKAAADPLAAAGGLLDAHVGLALALRLGPDLDPSEIDAARLLSLAAGREKSLVLWDKVYHKCTRPSESVWALRCVQVLFAGGCDDTRLGGLLTWTLCHPAGPALESARATLDVISAMSRTDPIRLWGVLGQSLVESMTASLGTRGPVCGWPAVVSAAAAGILPGSTAASAEAASKLLVAMALACHHPAVVGAFGCGSLWVSLAQRTGIDPAELCHGHLRTLKQTVREAMLGEFGSATFEAAAGLAQGLVLIGGSAVARQLLEFAREDIDPAALAGITDEDVAVWRAPADQLYFDPLAAKEKEKGARGSTKNKADAWAEQLQEEVARKRNQPRKLSKVEQELVAKQEAKESAARERVGKAHAGLRRGLALVRAVVSGSASVAGDVMLDIVRVVVERAIVGGAKASETLAGADVLATVQAMAASADGLAENLRVPVAMGLLRARGLEATVPPGWRQESMEDLATRVYFRLRVSCEASPLAPAGFNFLLPFMQATADAGGWGRKAKKGIEEHDEYAQLDHASEQLTMVVDIISFHAHFGYMEEMPRKEMLSLLIQLMATQPMLLAACRSSMVKMAGEMEGTDTPLERDVLIAGLAQPDSAVRNACLAALDFADLTEMDYSASVWLNTGGSGTEAVALEENAQLAIALWSDNSMEVQAGLLAEVVPFLNNPSAEIRDCSARSIGRAVQELVAPEGQPDDGATAPNASAVVDAALAELQSAYRRWYISLSPDYDEFGIVVPGTQHRVDIAEARVAVASALAHMAPMLTTPAQVQNLLAFLVEGGVLGERSEIVRTRMLAAGARAVECHGARWAGDLLPMLERFLVARDRGTATHDHIREGVVVLLGRLAQHLPADQDARVAAAVDQLIATLSTPSEPVQSAVSQCLPPLSKRVSDDKLAAVVNQLMDMTLVGETYSQRRGGAYGLAGVAKGRGLAVLKRFEIVDRLRAASEDREKFQRREGGLFAFETLSAAMGRLFEPYIIQFAPLLLALFSDPNSNVRDAALETARVIMRHISGHGVKLILPSTLAGLANDQWRTKKGSVEVLGAMAYCAPKQLSVALPAVVPPIIEVLTDTHGQVADAARRALLCFGDVISNPEIQVLVPTLLAALDDPTGKTDAALHALLYTAFIHYIDAPSLALVVPILQRGMRARAAATKRNAAQIMGSMATLTDPKDLAPYLDTLVPLVRTVLVDPVPEARATAAKALGSLVQRLKEDCFPSLVADLVAVLKGDASGVDRAGAAQGLSEVLSGIGVSRLEGLLPEVVANCGSARASVREGFMTLLVFLPTTFGDDFQQFLPQMLPLVLAGLADESELVRNAAQRAGRILVVTFARNATEALLPDLLSSMQSESWRIRHSSIELLGEFLYRVAGISDRAAEREREAARALFNAVQDEDGDDMAAAAAEHSDAEDEDDEMAEDDAAIMSNLREILSQKLGADRCRAVLAALYVARSDVSAMVRQAAFGVWKGIVSNTPRTVRECLPTIMDIVLVGLSAEEYDRRTTAARTLGDLVHKLGEAVMSQVVPILEAALRDQDAASDGGTRHGVFVGLSEILAATGKAHVEAYADAMIPLVRRGLCDEDVMVREAAATAFNGLQQTIGLRVIDMVVPPLLNALTQGSGGELDGIRPEHALEALRELMAVRANVVFPVLIPTLTAVPVTAFNARALSSLIQVSGAALGKRLPQILVSLFESLPVHQAAGNEEAEAALRDTVSAIAGTAARDEAALESLMLQLHESVKVGENTDLATSPKDASRVAEVCFALGAMCQAFGPGSAARGRTSLGSHVVDWLRILIDLLGATAARVVEASWGALDALCKAIPKDDYDGYVGPVSRAVQHATDALPRGQKTLPGFNLPKGVGPLLPIYSQGLLAGSPDTKERAVRGMARLVKFTEPGALRLFATGITGPLIRIVGDRHPPTVKAAILKTLGLLLVQIPALMRPFLPQLQRTFVRGLTGKEEVVRQRAAAALTALIPLQARLDPLVLELTAGVRQAESQGMRNAMMRAICAVVQAPNASALAEGSVQAIEAVVVGRVDGAEAGDTRWPALRSQAFGGLCGVVEKEAALELIAQHASVDASDSGATREVKLHYLAAALAEAPGLFAGSAELQARVVESVDAVLTSSSSGIQARATLPAVLVAKNALLDKDIVPAGSDSIAPLTEALVRVVAADSAFSLDSDAQHAALGALKAAAKHRYADVVEPARVAVIQAAMTHVRDRIITVKLAAERCALYALRLAKVAADGFEGSEAGLTSYVEEVGGASSERGKQVLDYQRRVLNKLADATRELDYVSDDEYDPARAQAAADDEADSDDEA